jgi:hypothetical protein
VARIWQPLTVTTTTNCTTDQGVNPVFAAVKNYQSNVHDGKMQDTKENPHAIDAGSKPGMPPS